MPVYIRAAGYKVYFWTNEGDEPIHFHVTKGVPSENDTKIWVLSNGSFLLAHNKSKIPQKDLLKIFLVMKDSYFEFLSFWKIYHPETIQFYK